MSKRDQLSELYSKLAPRVGAFLAARFPKQSAIIPDVVHDVFVRVLENERTLKKVADMPEADAGKYFLVAARNQLLSRLRRKVQETENLDDLLGTPSALVVPWERDPKEALIEKLAQLRSPYREVLDLLLIHECDVTEISRKTGRSMNAVYQQIHRGMAQLKEQLKK